MYLFFDPQVHFVAFSVDDLGLIPIHDIQWRGSGQDRAEEGSSSRQNVNKNNKVFI